MRGGAGEGVDVAHAQTAHASAGGAVAGATAHHLGVTHSDIVITAQIQRIDVSEGCVSHHQYMKFFVVS